jgi:hypothetical protein
MPSTAPSARAALPRPDVPAFACDRAAVARFDVALHAMHPSAPAMDGNRLADVARWFTYLPPDQQRRELQLRLGRLRELRRMAADADWDVPVALRGALDQLLAFVGPAHDGGEAQHALQDRNPRNARLDEALMVELAWPAFADELDDYRDFCRYRRDHHPPGAPTLTRACWHRLNARPGRLWRKFWQEEALR